MNQKILVVGATGYLGGLVVDELIKNGIHPLALVRDGSDSSKLLTKGVKIVKGDITVKSTLLSAMENVDVVISTAIGYTNRKKGDTLKTDDIGNKNIADIAKQKGIKRFVFASVLNCELAPTVPHFWQKKLSEDYFDKIGLPYVSIRPGAFLNQDPQNDFHAKGIRKGNWKVMGSKTKKWTNVLAQDVAKFLVLAAIDEKVPLEKINIGTEAPMSMEDIAAYIREYTGKPLKVGALPWPIIGTVLKIMGVLRKPVFGDAKKMFDFFFTGKYVADTRRQKEIFGYVPLNKDSVFKYCEQLGLKRA